LIDHGQLLAKLMVHLFGIPEDIKKYRKSRLCTKSPIFDRLFLQMQDFSCKC